jgi:uncharacterized protein (TIGR02284 family)
LTLVGTIRNRPTIGVLKAALDVVLSLASKVAWGCILVIGRFVMLVRKARLRLVTAALGRAAGFGPRCAGRRFHARDAATGVPFRARQVLHRRIRCKEILMSSSDVIDALNDLIETCRNGEKGFEACAKHAKAPELKSVFGTRAAECARAAEELEMQVRSLGGKPEHGGTAAAALHRGWLALRSSLSGFDDHALLQECERGEDLAVRRYRQALEKDLTPEVRSLVARQSEGAQHNHDQVRALRDRYPAAA